MVMKTHAIVNVDLWPMVHADDKVFAMLHGSDD